MRTILVTSGTKGGTGKSTIALNLSVLMAYKLRSKAQYPVILIDASVDSGSSTMLLFGQSNPNVQYTLIDLLDGRTTDPPLSVLYLRQWQVNGDQFNIVFAASGFSNLTRYRSLYPLSMLLNAIRSLSPILTIIDSPAMGMTGGDIIEVTAPYLTDVIPVMTPDHSSIKAAKLAVNSIKAVNANINVLNPILNMFDERYPPVDASTGIPWTEVAKGELGMEPFVVPLDEYVQIARQALEIEVLKIGPLESKAVASMINYSNEVLGKLLQ